MRTIDKIWEELKKLTPEERLGIYNFCFGCFEITLMRKGKVTKAQYINSYTKAFEYLRTRKI